MDLLRNDLRQLLSMNKAVKAHDDGKRVVLKNR